MNDGPQEPVSIPMGDPQADPVDISGQSDEGAQQGAPATSEPGGDDPVGYWKAEATKMRNQAQRFETYSGLIGYFEKNPQAVGQLEELITGGAVELAAHNDLAAQEAAGQSMSEEDILARELGMSTGGNPAQAREPKPVPAEVLVQRAKEQGAAEERNRIAFEQFQQELMTGGVPDHAVDQFVQFLQNPNALTYHDMFAAFNSNRSANGLPPVPMPPRGNVQRVQGAQPKDQPQRPQQQEGMRPPLPVQSMSGGSERPSGTKYTGGEGLDRAVVNPNEI